MHPAGMRCFSLEYSRYSRSSRLARQAPRPSRCHAALPPRAPSLMVDVLIAGAGPAGSIAAIRLARAGARVLLVDRARFPRDKLCGDTLNPGALRLLDGAGLRARVEAVSRPLEGMLITGNGGVHVRGTYGRGLFARALTRRVLDQLLVD